MVFLKATMVVIVTDVGGGLIYGFDGIFKVFRMPRDPRLWRKLVANESEE